MESTLTLTGQPPKRNSAQSQKKPPPKSPESVDEKTVFQPYEWQIAPWKDRSPVILLTGSAGGGKSALAAEKIHAVCSRYPGAQGLILRKTRESLMNSTVAFLEHAVIGRTRRVRHVAYKRRFEYLNGSILAYGGMKDEEQREQIRSIGIHGGLDICWMEEATAFVEDDFNEIRARMRGRATGWPQIMLSTNPDTPNHWIKQRLIDGKLANVYYSSALNNPANPESYLESLDQLTGVLRLRLRDGLWVQAEGTVYDEWDSTIHVVPHFKPDPAWMRIRSIDFGFTAPFVCQWWAIDEYRNMWLYRELYGAKRIVKDWAKDIKELSFGENIMITVCDWDAEDRATLTDCGIPNIQADKRVLPGINAVKGKLRKGRNNKPSLFVMEGALVKEDRALRQKYLPTCLAEEMPGYVWNDKKEEPVKANDHGCDAMRYAVMQVDKPRRGLFLWK